MTTILHRQSVMLAVNTTKKHSFDKNTLLLACDRSGVQIYWMTLEYVPRNMEKVLILSEKNTKMSPPQWIACQLYMSRIKLAAADWSVQNSQPITWRCSLGLMTTTLLRRSWNKTSSTIHEFKWRARVTEEVSSKVRLNWLARVSAVMAYYPYYPARMRDFRVSSLLESCSQFIPGVPVSSSSIPNNLNSNGPFPYSPYHPTQIAKQPSHFGHGAVPGPPQQVHIPVHDSQHENVEVSLENKDLWQRFYEEKTEMVITKAGRYRIIKILLWYLVVGILHRGIVSI